MARVAILGSCITRELWPRRDEAPSDLLYVSRTSLPSLFSTPVDPGGAPGHGLTRYQAMAVEADLTKRGLAELVAHRPTHLILDFIDERFDLLALPGGQIVTHSWELDSGGWLGTPAFAERREIPRLSGACEHLWRNGLDQMALLLNASVLSEAQIILHSARWADHQRNADGAETPLTREPHIWDGRPASLVAHNQLLARYEAAFMAAVPQAQVIAAAPQNRVADPAHRWGLSPFHYVPAYYDDIRQALAELGV
ncbi:DUF6270 domain-containing protein [Phenylobacterium sp.]|uniref:DUF6270 domain-containing protein n=1 Tax=Phenylobacterium sp. TaxID=1871053 RepID=UPI00272F90B1|nr:DUF6270 domain-containing protein [Phenylobacterium sp.]MDP1617877.1 DUF6270 domain-containing protein [Phenylobacterium sp.]MDP1987796.1 DUF6270 domain-containing protein [Phenylobacterium sp.]